MTARYRGLGVGAGVAVGPVARVHGPALPPRDGAPIDVDAETDRAEEALEAVADELEALAQRAGASGAVLVRQARMSRDPSLGALVRQVVQHVRQGSVARRDRTDRPDERPIGDRGTG